MFSNILRGPILRQYAVVIAVNLNLVASGMGIAWSSPILVKLRNSTESVLDRPITEEEGSWIVSIGTLVGALTNFIPALFLDYFGRKYAIFLAVLPKIIAALLFTFSSELWMILLARSINGVGDIIVFTVVPVYAAEVASNEIRGTLGSILQIMCSIGVVLMLSVGPFISYFAVNLLYTILSIVALLPSIFLPDSPYFLYNKGRNEESMKVLTFLRGSEIAAKDELKEYASAEGERVNKITLFKNKLFLKAMALNIVIVIGTQLIGFNAVSFYLQTILESTQTSVRPEIASVIIGIIQLTASLFSTSVTDRFGRKTILCSTNIGMMMGMIGLGVFFKVKETANGITGFMNYLPLISLILIVFCFSAGPGSVNWCLLSELLESSTRAVGLSITNLISSLAVFVTSRYFAPVMLAVGPTPTYLGFSVVCLLFCLFIAFCVPETKGKSFGEIQKALGNKMVDDDDNDPKLKISK